MTAPTKPLDDEFDEELEIIRIELQQGDLVDRFGHKHSEHIFRNWSPKTIRVMGIRRVGNDGDAK
jgi:hypothetical protein